MTALSVSATAEATIAGVTAAESQGTCLVTALMDGQIGEGAVEVEEVVEETVTTVESLDTCLESVLTAVEAEAAVVAAEAATGMQLLINTDFACEFVLRK